MVTSSEWIAEFCALTGIEPVAAVNYARSLRLGGLYAKPSRGGGHRKTSVAVHQMSNFIFAQAATQASGAVDAVRQIRAAMFAANPIGERPYLGEGDFGDVFDRLMSGSYSDAKDSLQIPNHIVFCLNPASVELVWCAPNGSVARRQVYISPDFFIISPRQIIKKTEILASVMTLAHCMLCNEGKAAELQQWCKDNAHAKTARPD
jgi:hypothetical protein